MAVDRSDMPIGFAMELAMQPESMDAFGQMTGMQQYQVIQRARQVNSKGEMERLVRALASGKG